MKDIYQYFDSDELIEALQSQPSKQRILIIEEDKGKGYVSSTALALELMKEEYPEIEYFVAVPGIVSEKTMQYIDSVIMPGGLDHFPEKTFGKKDLPTDACTPENSKIDFCLNEREELYPKISAWADKYGIPEMGICLGNQFLALHHDAVVSPTNDKYFELDQVNVYFDQSSLAYLYTLSEEEQENALKTCQLPHVQFNDVYVRHTYAVQFDQYENLKIGAISEHNVVQSVEHGDRQIGFQFHFEASLAKEMKNDPRFRNILGNFIRATAQYHMAVNDDLKSKIKSHNEQVLERMAYCQSLLYEGNGDFKNLPENLPEFPLRSIYEITPMATTYSSTF